MGLSTNIKIPHTVKSLFIQKISLISFIPQAFTLEHYKSFFKMRKQRKEKGMGWQEKWYQNIPS